MLSEIWSSIQHAAKERITNPLAGSFLVFSAACNWKVLAALFIGSGDISTRMSLAKENAAGYCLGLFTPLGLSIAYVAIMPLASVLVHEWQLRWRSTMKTASLGSEIDLTKKRLLLAEKESAIEIERTRPSEEAKQRERAHELSRIHAQNDQMSLIRLATKEADDASRRGQTEAR